MLGDVLAEHVVELRGRMEEGRNAAGRREENLDTLTHRHQSAMSTGRDLRSAPRGPTFLVLGKILETSKPYQKFFPNTLDF